MKECRKGHAMTPENTRANGRCSTCERENAKVSAKALYERRLAALVAGDMIYCVNGHLFTARTLSPKGRCRVCLSDAQRRVFTAQREREGRSDYRLVCKRGHPRVPENRDRYGRCLACCRIREKRLAAAVRNDPVRLADRRERQRIYDTTKRRAQGIPARNWRDVTKRGGHDKAEVAMVDSGPLLGWLDDWLVRHPNATLRRLTREAGSSVKRVQKWRGGEGVNIATVDRFLVAADEPWLLDELYPLEDSVAA